MSKVQLFNHLRPVLSCFPFRARSCRRVRDTVEISSGRYFRRVRRKKYNKNTFGAVSFYVTKYVYRINKRTRIHGDDPTITPTSRNYFGLVNTKNIDDDNTASRRRERRVAIVHRIFVGIAKTYVSYTLGK